MKIPYAALQTGLGRSLEIVECAADFYRARLERFETHPDDVPHVAEAMETARRQWLRNAELATMIRSEVGQ